ncbi:MAG: hypothetical protein ACOX7K_00735 [Oscillospiraceae bacterium]
MIGLVVLGILLLFLVLLAILPVGMDGRYQEGNASVFLKLGPLRVQLIPWKQKKKRKTQEKKVKKKKTKSDAQQAGTKSGKKDYFSLVKIIFRTLRRFQRKLSVDFLMLHYTAASDDPYDTVLQYGRMSAAVGSLLPLSKQVFHIKKQDVVLDLTFEVTKPIINARVEMTLRVWEILYISLQMLLDLLKWKRKQSTAATQSPAASEQPTAQAQVAVTE